MATNIINQNLQNLQDPDTDMNQMIPEGGINFNNFLSSIDWVAPRPTTFRINLRNDENFYLIWMGRSWIAQVEGKKYYLLNLPEEERAVEAIARILRYGKPVDADVGVDTESEDESPEVEDDVEIDIDA